MILREITKHRDVILFAIQQRKVRLLEFNEIWQLCKTAAPNLPGAIQEESSRSGFVWQMLGTCEDLENDGFVSRHTKDSGTKLMRITLTERGARYISSVVFTHQDRMGRFDAGS